MTKVDDWCAEHGLDAEVAIPEMVFRDGMFATAVKLRVSYGTLQRWMAMHGYVWNKKSGTWERDAAIPLTEPQQRMVNVIAKHKAERGFPPSIFELQKSCGYASTSGVSYTLAQLRAKGRVTWKRGKARTLRVLEDAGE